MDILTEQGATYDECFAKIVERHGPNIHILRHQKIRTGGLWGFFEKDAVELSYIINRSTERWTAGSAHSAPPRTADFHEEKRKILTHAASTSPALASRMAPQLAALSAAAQRPVQPAGGSGSAAESVDINEVLRAVQRLGEKIDRGQGGSAAEENAQHDTLEKLEKLFELNDFSPTFSRQMISRVKKEFSLDALDRYDEIQDAVVEWIGQSFSVWTDGHAARPRIIVLVGPTGVGKTTTVAKLAASYSLAAAKGSRPLNVRIITIDNYRIGAIQQIEIYGNIMNIPVSCAQTPSDLKTLMAMYAQDVDIILIDTIGKSPRDYTRIAEMRQFLDAAGPLPEVHLAVSATTKSTDMREIIQQYETFGYGSVIITKFDETTRVGNIISILNEKQKAVSYVTTGQRVPQDFEQASIVRFLTNLEGFRINRTRIENLFPPGESIFQWR